jgi:hypothetical protein
LKITGRPKEFAKRQLILPGGARSPVQVLIAFIDAHREVYAVEPICKVLPITPSTYREHVAADAIRRRRPHARGAMRFCGQIRPVERSFRNRVHMTSAAAA